MEPNILFSRARFVSTLKVPFSLLWFLWLLQSIYSDLKTWSWDPEIIENMCCLSFWVWVTWLSIIISSSFNSPANFICLQLNSILLCMCYVFIVYPSVKEHYVWNHKGFRFCIRVWFQWNGNLASFSRRGIKILLKPIYTITPKIPFSSQSWLFLSQCWTVHPFLLRGISSLIFLQL